MRSRYLLGAIVATIAAGVAAPPADACINPMKLAKDAAVQKVAEAEKLIAAGDYHAAADLLDEHNFIGNEHGVQFVIADPALQHRVELLAATAVLRDRPDARQIAGARALLEDLWESDPENPVVTARVAEARALAANARDRASALAELTALEQHDLVPDAVAYAVLVRLRLAAKDPVGAARAQDRCTKMTRRPGACGPAIPRAGKASKRRTQ